ncbi:MAG: helix-turn-helix domain-containing protein [Spirochaetes bacterium]|nr:helix-turn-helix domain-containing protein [Spirochaetota bacterium]
MRLHGFATVRTLAVTPHTHTDYEFHYIISGTGSYTVNGRTYPVSAGSFLLSFPGETHCVDGGRTALRQLLFCCTLDGDDSRLAADLAEVCRDRRVFPVGEKQLLFFEGLRSHAERGGMLAKSAAHRFAAFLYERSGRDGEDATHRSIVAKCLAMIHRPSEFIVKDAAKVLGVSPEYLIRSFKKELGLSPVQYRIRMKMETACLYLLQTSKPVAEVAQLSGFEDELYFSRMFRKWTGMSPTNYRIKIRLHQN